MCRSANCGAEPGDGMSFFEWALVKRRCPSSTVVCWTGHSMCHHLFYTTALPPCWHKTLKRPLRERPSCSASVMPELANTSSLSGKHNNVNIYVRICSASVQFKGRRTVQSLLVHPARLVMWRRFGLQPRETCSDFSLPTHPTAFA